MKDLRRNACFLCNATTNWQAVCAQCCTIGNVVYMARHVRAAIAKRNVANRPRFNPMPMNRHARRSALVKE